MCSSWSEVSIGSLIQVMGSDNKSLLERHMELPGEVDQFHLHALGLGVKEHSQI